MAGAVGGAANSAALQKRQALAGKSGYRGLVQNSRVFLIAVFASLGGLLYGYNQGVFSSVLGMYSFNKRMASVTEDSGTKGWLVAILELGAWFGVLCTGQLADRFGRKRTILLAVVVFVIGVIVQTAAFKPVSIFVGRFITGLGVGSLSMAVPLYNAELAPPEVRGSLVAMQQMSIVTGIMVSFWIDYGTNYIGGVDEGQSEAAWRIPLALQLVPALILGVGVIFMPFSPRWLVAQGRDEEALKVLCMTRELPEESELIQIEYLEIKAEVLFESELEKVRYPQYQDGSRSSRFKLGLSKYTSLITNRTYLIRVAVGSLTMFFQQWTGINAVLYYAPSIFVSLGLSGNTISLLATGVVGITMFLTTIPTVIYIDQIGRKPVLVSGAIIMGVCHLIIAILSARFNDSWPEHTAAGWVACVLVWIFAAAFGYSWGPAAWVLVAEIYPISVRGPGMSVAASSNWMNNFIVGQVTPSMMEHITYGTFIFFGLFSLMGGAFVHFFVPETKGLTLEEMDLAFGDSSGTAAADRERMAEISARIGLSRLTGEAEGSHRKEDTGLDEKRKDLRKEDLSSERSRRLWRIILNRIKISGVLQSALCVGSDLSNAVANELILVESYKNQFTQAQIAVKSARNNLTNVPINSLPAEVLTYIFHLVSAQQVCPLRVPDHWDSETSLHIPKYPDVFSHVCSQWRQIALASNVLWSHIDIALSCPLSKGFHERAATYVTRARQAPLEIHFIDPGHIRRAERALTDDSSSEQGLSGTDSLGGWCDWDESMYDNNPDEFTFLDTAMCQIRSLGLIVRYECHPKHNTALGYCLTNCAPGGLSELVINVPNESYRIYLKAVPDLTYPEDGDINELFLSKQQLEDAWRSVTILDLSGVYPHRTSSAYHGLTELRLLNIRSIPGLAFVGALKSSPGLRVLRGNFGFSEWLDMGTPSTHIALQELGTLDLKGMYTFDVRRVLQLLKPGPGPLRLGVSSNPTPALLREFFARSNVRELFFNPMFSSLDRGELHANLLYLPLQLRILIIADWGLSTIYGVRGTFPSLGSQGTQPPENLDTLYMARCHYKNLQKFHEIVAKYSPRKLVVWNCHIGSSLGGKQINMPLIEQLGESLSKSCSSIECLTYLDPNPLQAWDGFDSATM